MGVTVISGTFSSVSFLVMDATASVITRRSSARSHYQGGVRRNGMLEERAHTVLDDRRFIDVQSARQSGISFAGAKLRHGERSVFDH
jgi:hypothetical protein